MKYLEWQNTPARFRAMTGYDLSEFNELLPYFEAAHDEYLSRYNLNGKPRKGQRTYVIYTNSPLRCVRERLLFILSYLKLNPIQEHHADTFSMTQKQCHELIHGMYEILKRALKNANVVPANSDKAFQEVLSKAEFSQDALLLHDGTEREIPRPVDDEIQKEMYSGKKKKHSVKNAVIIAACCLILYVSRTFAGRVHDKTIADFEYTIPAGYTLVQDTGYRVLRTQYKYQGYKPEDVNIIQPLKKPRGKELTQEQKDSNRRISSYRVRVEHAIGSTKRYRIVKDECRLRKNNFVDNALLYCAALHNFRLKTRPFNYKNKFT
jgi:hypothetical protein